MIAYGYASITYDGRTINFIPSFKNIEKIGTPKQIVDTYNLLSTSKLTKHVFAVAMHVLDCCIEGEDKDLSPIFGGLSVNYHGDRLMWIKGAEPHQNAIIMARHMMLHGVSGKHKFVDKASDDKPATEFNPSEFIAIARRILEIGLEEAKNMTMTELLIMIDDVRRANESQTEKMNGGQSSKVPTIEEHKAAMAYRDAVHN